MNKKLHQSGGKRGRGSLITLLSKTTVNLVIDTIQHLIQKSIPTDIQKVGQSRTSPLRTSYVTDVINERLVAVLKYNSSTGQSFVNLLENFKLDNNNFIYIALL